MTAHRAVRVLLPLFAAAAVARPALAHAGSLAGSLRPAPVPFWLVVASGGGLVGVSFLFTSFVTDHETIRALNEHHVGLSSVEAVRTVVVPVLRAAGVATLLAVVAFALVGPTDPLRNLAVLVVWVGWWAGYTMSAYLFADTWSLVNPWRTLAAFVPLETRPYPSRVGAWPSVAGLVGLVWLEVVSPVAADPRWLAAVVVGYTAVSVAGAAAYGEAWFRDVDPVARVFRLYGLLAPVQRTEDGVSVSFPGAALARGTDAMTDGDVAFVVALLWVTTYDGLVSTAPWNGVVRAVAGVGVPPRFTHLAAISLGFVLVLAAYRLSARLVRRTADTYVTGAFVARWFAPALLPIAAGYHLAHFLGYFLGLAPAFVAVAADPLSPPLAVPRLLLPAWFGSLQLGFVVVGHLVAVWVAHARSFELFPGRLQPIRSQYPFVVVMIAYTAGSLWVVAQPFASPLT